MSHTSSSESSHLSVSVVVPSYNTRSVIQYCLSSVIPQAKAFDAEVIVIDSSSDDTDQLIAESFPSVKLYHFEERKLVPQARTTGIAHTKGNVIAFIDADCSADPHWLKNIIARHNAGHEIVGGAMLNHPDNSLTGWAYYFVGFSRWIPHGSTREVNYLPGGNVSYSRVVIEQQIPSTAAKFPHDITLHTALRHAGKRLYYDPSIVVRHLYLGTFWEFLPHAIKQGFRAGKVNMCMKAFSRFLMLLLVLLGPLLPFMKVAMIVWRTLRNGTMTKKLIASFPLVVLASACWEIGEWAGFIWGFSMRTNQGEQP